jgi:hypothetical protein
VGLCRQWQNNEEERTDGESNKRWKNVLLHDCISLNISRRKILPLSERDTEGGAHGQMLVLHFPRLGQQRGLVLRTGITPSKKVKMKDSITYETY